MTLLLIVAACAFLKLKGWLTFTQGGDSPFHFQLTAFGFGVTIRKPDA